jgi:hypothetical protein
VVGLAESAAILSVETFPIKEWSILPMSDRMLLEEKK